MEQVANLIIPFITLAILSVMIDRFTLFLEGLMHKIPGLPDSFEWWSSYIIVLFVSTVVCWQGDFRFFDYLHLHFKNILDYIMTGLVISGGSSLVQTQWSVINKMPSSLTSIFEALNKMIQLGKNTIKVKMNKNKNNSRGE